MTNIPNSHSGFDKGTFLSKPILVAMSLMASATSGKVGAVLGVSAFGLAWLLYWRRTASLLRYLLGHFDGVVRFQAQIGIGFYFLFSGLVIVQELQKSSLISGGATAVSVLSALWTITVCALSSKTPTRSILCIVYGIGTLCLLNVVADLTGVGIALYSERTEVIGSRFKDGGFRWQSPLFSSWQLSGLARWAGPVGIILVIGVLKSKVERFLAIGYICAILFVLVRVEYRAALIPFSFVPFWFFIKSSRFRRIGCVMVIIYALAAPWIYSSYIVHDIVEAILPEALVRMSGTSREQIATMSDRTELWSAATEFLHSGEYFWRGQGLLGLDASFLAVIDTSVYEGLIERYSFHQGALDVLYIFGTFGGGVLITLLLWVVFHIACARSYDNQYSQMGILSLAIVASSNCHDGFLNAHTGFFAIVYVSIAVAWRGAFRMTNVVLRHSQWVEEGVQ